MIFWLLYHWRPLERGPLTCPVLPLRVGAILLKLVDTKVKANVSVSDRPLSSCNPECRHIQKYILLPTSDFFTNIQTESRQAETEVTKLCYGSSPGDHMLILQFLIKNKNNKGDIFVFSAQ